MHFVCIVLGWSFTATVSASVSTSYDDPYGYYDESADVRPDFSTTTAKTIVVPRFTSSPHTIVAKEGESRTLDCATTVGSNVRVWEKGGQTIALGDTMISKEPTYQLRNHSLLIKNISSASTGYYKCVMIIDTRTNITLTHKIKLEDGAEIISLLADNNITQLHKGNTLKLTCEIEGKPMPTIEWYFEKPGVERRRVENKNHQSTGYKDTLIINGVSRKHNGTYICKARNDRTNDIESIAIEIIDADTSRGLQLLPSIVLFIASFILLNP